MIAIMNRSIAAAVFFAIVAPSFAQDWAVQKLDKSPRHQEWVDLKADGRTIHTFVVYPETGKKAPVVLIVHEIFGLTDWARELADQVAAAGYIAIAPDLLSGKAPNGGNSKDFPSIDVAREVNSMLNADEVSADLDAAADYAKKLPSANGKLAVAGFCWGGGQSFQYATRRRDLSAAFVFYGPPPEHLQEIKAPVYGFYGGNDARITATVKDAVAAMKKAHKRYEPVVYEGAGHGFMRAGEDPAGTPENKKARDEAWKRWRSLLKRL